MSLQSESTAGWPAAWRLGGKGKWLADKLSCMWGCWSIKFLVKVDG